MEMVNHCFHMGIENFWLPVSNGDHRMETGIDSSSFPYGDCPLPYGYQSKTIREPKYVSYDAQLCPVIAKGQRAPNAQLTHQIVDRHYEDLKSSGPDSQTHKNPV